MAYIHNAMIRVWGNHFIYNQLFSSFCLTNLMHLLSFELIQVLLMSRSDLLLTAQLWELLSLIGGCRVKTAEKDLRILILEYPVCEEDSSFSSGLGSFLLIRLFLQVFLLLQQLVLFLLSLHPFSKSNFSANLVSFLQDLFSFLSLLNLLLLLSLLWLLLLEFSHALFKPTLVAFLWFLQYHLLLHLLCSALCPDMLLHNFDLLRLLSYPWLNCSFPSSSLLNLVSLLVNQFILDLLGDGLYELCF